MRRTLVRHLGLMAGVAMIAASAEAQSCGWSYIDHRVSYDASGAWDSSVYRGMMDALTIAQIGGALWEGAESRLGKTMWQGIDAELIAGAAAALGEDIFTRVRPQQTGGKTASSGAAAGEDLSGVQPTTENDPCLWFQGGSNHSFPSGEASVAAGLVTPYILEYGNEYPATYLLALIPLYVGVGRIKNQAHWQSDVLAGWAVGGLSGWYAHSRDTPILIELLPHGVAVGLHVQF